MKIEMKGMSEAALKKAKSLVAAVEKSLRESIAAAPPELRARAKQLLIGAAALFIVISGYKFISYKFQQRALLAELAAGPWVRTAKVTQGPGQHTVVLIGETRPYESATLYAKVSGYLRSVKVDKGDSTKKGQMLAVIESPETDEAYIAAQADARNKTAIWNRMQALYKKQLVSQQEAEQAQADADVASAKLRSQRTLKDYEILRAPFDGTITARYADPGALVQNATNSESSALPVVMISQIHRLRVDVFLDQRDAPYVAQGDPVEITLSDQPGFKIDGLVARLSDELDPRTKMLLTEIDIPNDDLKLVAGSFVQVAMQIKAPPYLEAPVEALALVGNKSYLTVINADDTLAYKSVQIADNDGKTLHIVSGVQVGTVLALSIGNSLPEGSKVRPVVEKGGK